MILADANHLALARVSCRQENIPSEGIRRFCLIESGKVCTSYFAVTSCMASFVPGCLLVTANAKQKTFPAQKITDRLLWSP